VGTNDLTCLTTDSVLTSEGGRAQRLGRPLPPGVGSSATSTNAYTATSTSLTVSSTKSAATGGATGRPMIVGGAGVLVGIIAAAAL
jgi:hypothetical protein